MDPNFPLADLLPLAALLAVGGACAGLLAGMFGVGGGAIIVPILYQIMQTLGFEESVLMHVSVGTSLGIIVPTAIRSYRAHLARGGVDSDLLRRWIAPVIIGVAVGTGTAYVASGTMLKIVFVAVTYALAMRMLLGSASLQLGSEMPRQPLLGAYGFGIGFFSVMIGVGGGILSNAVMSLYGRPIHQAVATASGLGILISIPGMLGFVASGWGDPRLPPYSLGYVSLIGVALVTPITTLMAPLGARLAYALPRRGLEGAFGAFLFAVGTRFLVDLL